MPPSFFSRIKNAVNDIKDAVVDVFTSEAPATPQTFEEATTTMAPPPVQEEEELENVWMHVYGESRYSQGQLCSKEFFLFTTDSEDKEQELKEAAEVSFAERGSSSRIEASGYSVDEVPGGPPEDYDLNEVYEQDEGVQDVRTRKRGSGGVPTTG